MIEVLSSLEDSSHEEYITDIIGLEPNIVLCVDNKAALHSLIERTPKFNKGLYYINSQILLRTLNRFEHLKIILCWTPGHSGIPGIRICYNTTITNGYSTEGKDCGKHSDHQRKK